MAILELSSDQMRSALIELEQALHNHERWLEELHANLICSMPADQGDLEEDAHRRCRFGQWYYGPGLEALRRFPGFAEIEIEHERMHRFAKTLLLASASRMPISMHDCERFVGALKRMRLEVDTSRRELDHALHDLDPLTGIPSRTGMLSSLRNELEMVKRKVHPCCISMIDIDHFKIVNDTYGHGTGDQVLVTISHHILSHLRPYDLFFRYGGEELLLCLVNANIESGREIIDRLRDELAELLHHADGCDPFHVTVSCGVTPIDAEVSVEQSIERADQALYAAKSAGRNRTVVWEPSSEAKESAITPAEARTE